MTEQELLKSILWYDPDTGLFIRRATGKPAGSIRRGVRVKCAVVRVAKSFQAGKQFLAHRVAWLYMTGDWPKLEIDHINGNSLDNRWVNLREVDRFGQMQNRHTSVNPLGVMGVSQLPSGRYRTRIGAFKERRTVGTYDTLEEAKNAYLQARKI